MKTIIIEVDHAHEVIERYKGDEKALHVLTEIFAGNDELHGYIGRLWNHSRKTEVRR